jgi:hypothetical protein
MTASHGVTSSAAFSFMRRILGLKTLNVAALWRRGAGKRVPLGGVPAPAV